jgi:CDP-glycerol glycerophosphotransferase (TagB/SpsB family)
MKVIRKLKLAVLVALLPLLKLTQWIIGLIPRRADYWVFGSYVNSFTDNSKYLYTYVTDKHPEIRAVWITSSSTVIKQLRAAGGRACFRWSPVGIYYAIRAKCWFVSAYVSDINVYLSRGARLVNLWHGIPLKKIEFDIENGPLRRSFHQPTMLERFVTSTHLFRKPDWVLSTSDYVTEASFASAFKVEPARCLSFGYPRLDAFYWDAPTRSAWLKKWGGASLSNLIEKVSKFEDVVVYMPTWRDSNPNFLNNAGFDFFALNEDLRNKNRLLILKLHVATPKSVLQPLAGMSNIHLMDTCDDMYPLLPLSDALITDYSSIYLDYVLLSRPICFFAFDLETYLAESRGFYHDYRTFSPGVKAITGEQVTEFVVGTRQDLHADERAALAGKLHGQYAGDASQKIVNFFKAQYIGRK